VAFRVLDSRMCRSATQSRVRPTSQRMVPVRQRLGERAASQRKVYKLRRRCPPVPAEVQSNRCTETSGGDTPNGRLLEVSWAELVLRVPRDRETEVIGAEGDQGMVEQVGGATKTTEAGTRNDPGTPLMGCGGMLRALCVSGTVALEHLGEPASARAESPAANQRGPVDRPGHERLSVTGQFVAERSRAS